MSRSDQQDTTNEQPTTCMRCAVGCGYLQQSSEVDSELVAVTENPAHPATGGEACQRGMNETARPSGNRLTQPLIRHGNTLQPTDWDTALGAITTRLIDTIRTDPDSVAILGSGQQTNEAAYALGKMARGVIGTQHYDANTTLCMASAVSAYHQAFASDAPPPTYDDVPDAQTHIVWGANPAVAHPVLSRWIETSADKDDSSLYVIDPVETQTADNADVHARPEPGTDLALARAVLRSVLSSGDVDTEFVKEHTDGYEEMCASLPELTTAASTAGVSLETVHKIATALTDKTLIYWGMGVNQSIQGTETARALIDLCLATGNMGPGSGPFSLTGQANSMGNRVCASKNTWPGHRPFDDAASRRIVADTWEVPLTRLPTSSGPGFIRIVDELARDNIDICWTVATNPVAGMPDASHVKRALKDAFVIVQDAFHSDTVACADVVLPAATWGESQGTTTNMERRVSRVTAATDPPGKARQDLDIIAAIGNQLDSRVFDAPSVNPKSVFDEIRTMTAGTSADLSGISYERLDRELAVRWPAPNAETQGGYRYYNDGEWAFHTDSDKAQFSTVTHSRVPEPADESYPLTLTTGRVGGMYNTGMRSGNTETVPRARINPDTILESLTALNRGQAKIESRRGGVTVDVSPSDNVPPGMVWLPIHHSAINELTLAAVDPDSAEPNLKQCAVRLSPPKGS